MQKREFLYTVGGNVHWCNHYGKQHGSASKKLKNELPHDPAIPLQGIYLKKKKNGNTALKRYKHPNVHSSIIYHSQDIEAT